MILGRSTLHLYLSVLVGFKQGKSIECKQTYRLPLESGTIKYTNSLCNYMAKFCTELVFYSFFGGVVTI